jgi:predicted acyltransferase (DUF342 family)
MILFIFLTLGFAITSMTSGEIKVANNHLKSTQAFYIAEGGIAEAINVLLANPRAAGTIIDKMPIGNGEVTVTGAWTGNVITLEAVGTVDLAKRTVKQNVRVEAGSSIFTDAITTFADSTGDWVELNRGTKITGDLAVGVKVGINNNVMVKGNFYARQEPSYNYSGVNVLVDEELNLPDFPQLPELPQWQKPGHLGEPKIYGYVNNADVFKTGEKYFKAGYVDLSGNLEFNDEIYIECTSLALKGTKYEGVTFVADGAININQNNIDFENVNLIGGSSIGINGANINFAQGLINTKGALNIAGDDGQYTDIQMYAKDSIGINGSNLKFTQGTINTQGALNINGSNGQYTDVQIYASNSSRFAQNTTVIRGFIVCNQAFDLGSNFQLTGHILSKGWLNVGQNSMITGSVGGGSMRINENTEIIHSEHTGAPIPSTIPGGTTVTKLRWSEGQKEI